MTYVFLLRIYMKENSETCVYQNKLDEGIDESA